MGDRTGEAFQVVRYTGGEQSFHSMDMLTCGKYVVTWCSGAEQTEYKGIFGRQFMVIDKPYIDISANDSDGSGDNSGCMVDLITN